MAQTWYAHIDHLDQPNAYLIRVTELRQVFEKDSKGRDKLVKEVSGAELLRFEHKSGLRGPKLRNEVEQLAAEKVKAL